MVAQELDDLGPVGGILVDAELDVLGELLVERLVLLLVLGHLGEQLEALLDNVLADDLKKERNTAEISVTSTFHWA